MLSEQTPMTVETLRRLMCELDPFEPISNSAAMNAARTASRMGIAIGLVLAGRKSADWGWLDQDSPLGRSRP